MDQTEKYADIISRLNTKISIPYIFKKDVGQNNVVGISHKIIYKGVEFDVLLGAPIYINDGTRNGMIIIYPIYESSRTENTNRKIGIYEIIPEQLNKVYENMRDGRPNINMLGQPYFYNFILGENGLAFNTFTKVQRDHALKYGLFAWNHNSKVAIGSVNVDNYVDKSVVNNSVNKPHIPSLAPGAPLAPAPDVRELAQLEARRHGIEQKTLGEKLELEKVAQDTKLKDKLTERQALKTARGTLKQLLAGASLFNTTRKKKKEKYIYEDYHNWLQKFMKNEKYELDIHDDTTLFGALSQKLDTEAHMIREKLGEYVTKDDFLKQRAMHEKMASSIRKLNETSKLSAVQKVQLHKLSESMKGYEYLSLITSFEEFKMAMKDVPGNLLLLTIIERMYDNKYKFLVLKNNNRVSKARETNFEKIVMCNNTTDDALSKTANKNMQYGMISLDNGKYNNIKYDTKSILLYGDVPGAVQKRLVDNCINV